MRLLVTQGMPNLSENQAIGSASEAPGSGKVTRVPSWKVKVMLSIWPLTQERVQSPLAIPDILMPLRPGILIPFEDRFSGPTMILKGYGSTTCPPTGIRPSIAVMEIEPSRVALSGIV